MKKRFFASLGDRMALAATLVMLVGPVVPASAQSWMKNVFLAVTASSTNPPLPKGVKIIASVPLQGQPVTRMYTQDEYGHIYLYIEHGPRSLTAVDVTKKLNPKIVNHEPGSIEPARYEELSEGGTIQVSPLFTVSKGFDNEGRRSMLGTLESGNPDDAKLLRAFGRQYVNLVDPDRRLVFFASVRYLFVVQDNRLTAIDFISN